VVWWFEGFVVRCESLWFSRIWVGYKRTLRRWLVKLTKDEVEIVGVLLDTRMNWKAMALNKHFRFLEIRASFKSYRLIDMLFPKTI